VTTNPKLAEANTAKVPSNPAVSLIWQASALFICFLAIFGPTMPPMYSDWRTFDTFSHGLLVPFIAAYMLWQKRAELSQTIVAPSPWGVTLLIPAVLLGLLGKVIGDNFTERIGLVLSAAGLVWLILGWEWFKRASFPLAYLFLMIPLPYAVVKEVAHHLRILDAALAAPALRALGVPVYRDSYYLHLPDITLEVADLCSGISSVFALFALGAAYVYFSPLRPREKLLALMSTVPFAALINLLRIILTAALAYHVSPVVLGMLIHEMTGTITFFIALLLFIALTEFLHRKLIRSTPRTVNPIADASGDCPAAMTTLVENKSWRPFAAGMAVLIPAVFLAFGLKAEGSIPLIQELATVRSEIAGFQGSEMSEKEAYRDPNAEKELIRRYVGPSGEWIDLYVGFRGNQSGSKRLAAPKLQFPYGWNYVWIEPTRFTSRNVGLINANWMMTQNNQRQVLVLYWYQRGSMTLASETQNRLNQLRGAIIDHRTDGAVVRLAMATDAEKIDQTKARLTAFAADLYPELLRILPQ
jgi:EpsI family protein